MRLKAYLPVRRLQSWAEFMLLVIMITLTFYLIFKIVHNKELIFNQINALTSRADSQRKSVSKTQSIDLYKIVERKNVKKDPFKYILIQSTIFGLLNKVTNGAKDATIGPEFFMNSGCEVPNCVLTFNRSLLENIYDFDAVFIHGTENHEATTPKLRSPHQKYIMGTLEPPCRFLHALNVDDNFYNWTMTYKLNSDIVWPYARIFDKMLKKHIAPAEFPPWREPDDFNDEDVLKLVNSKTKIAAQFVSHCNASSQRDELVRILQKYIPVDVYGECGPLKCYPDKASCEYTMERDYLFYLSFENEICEDYVTEKLYKVMGKYVIPIVYGGADYNKWVPPRSYIDANKFDTVENLGKYLSYLIKHPEEYIKYFWWKKYYGIDSDLLRGFCNLCAKLHKPNIQEKTEIYTNILAWFFDTCTTKHNINFV